MVTQRSERSSIPRLGDMRRYGIASLTVFLLYSAPINLAAPLARIASTTQEDSKIAAAQQTFAEGQRLLAEGTVVSERRAIEKFAETVPLWRAVGDKRREAITLSFIGKVYDLLGEKQNALDYYAQTLALMRAVGDRTRRA